jgi:trimethylamine--corrinoid protein Co-methyltransferase
MIYSSDTATADMSTGGLHYESPDKPILCASIAQLARFYSIPSCVSHDKSDEKSYAVAAGFKNNALRIAVNNMTYSDLAVWMGTRDKAVSASLWDLALDAELVRFAKEYHRSFIVDDNALAVDAIAQIGPGGHFMGCKHTVINLRKQVSLYNYRDNFIFAST